MRKIEAQTVMAIRRAMADSQLSGRVFKSGNMEVVQTHYGTAGSVGYFRMISVRLHGNRIAAIDPHLNRMTLKDCGYQTTTTKSRLNALLGAFVPGERITQTRFEWNLSTRPWEDSEEFVMELSADNWVLQQAEKLAA